MVPLFAAYSTWDKMYMYAWWKKHLALQSKPSDLNWFVTRFAASLSGLCIPGSWVHLHLHNQFLCRALPPPPGHRAVFVSLSGQGLLILNLPRKWKSAVYIPSATGWPFCTPDRGAGRGLQRELPWFLILNRSRETEHSVLVVLYWFARFI